MAKPPNQPRQDHSTRKLGLDRDAVVTAALDLVDEEGLEALTIRNVSRRLGVWPATVYWHMSDYDSLLSAVVSRATGSGVLHTDLPSDWREGLKETARHYRRAVHDHPNIAPALVTGSDVNGTRRFPIVERYLYFLDLAGYDEETIVDSYNAFFGAALGFIALELGGVSSEPDATQGWKKALRDGLNDLSPSTYPTLHRYRRSIEDRAFAVRWTPGAEKGYDSGFERLLTMLIAGLEAGDDRRLPHEQ